MQSNNNLQEVPGAGSLTQASLIELRRSRSKTSIVYALEVLNSGDYTTPGRLVHNLPRPILTVSPFNAYYEA